MSKRLLVVGFFASMSITLVSAQSGQKAQSAAPSTAIAGKTQTTPITANTVKSINTAPSAAAIATQRAFVDKYCIGCHGGEKPTAGLKLDKLDLAHLGDHADVGEKVVRKLRAGMMPPTGAARPDDASRETLIRFMEGELDRASTPKLVAPGLHRLNRTEYTNAIRDLLALDIDATKFLPSDDSSHGFDNMAGTLTMSPALMEAYLSAAGKISRLAIGEASPPKQAVFDVPADTAQNFPIEGLPFGTRGGILIKYVFPSDGEYSFKVKGVTGYFTAVLGGIKGEQLEVLVDGERVKLFDWDKDISNTRGDGKSTPRIPVKAGLHTVGVTFLATNDIPGSELNKPFARTMNTPGSIPGFLFYPHVGQVEIEGPYTAVAATDTTSLRKIFVCHPATAKDEPACARTIISTLVKHAYRRPATPSDLSSLLDFYQAGRNDTGSFVQGVEAALQRILVDPEFIYRGEAEPASVASGARYRVNDLALASRLSFFLWSSIPDDQLIDLAAQGRLKDPVVLEQQVRRMLADPKADALIKNFTGQWLNVRGLKSSEPVVNLFPDFDDNLRDAFQKEAELFFGSIVREDRSVLDLLTANYTFVNERLAKHYGIPNLYGPQFRRVTLPAELDMRRGLLGKGAMLTVTSFAARTSPVVRGKWFLTTFLGISPPDPPPNVPIIKEKPADSTGNLKAPTLRQTMEAHRAVAPCSTCHKIFEPLGLAMENFDAVAAWRTMDEGSPIDATGVFVDGTKLDGVTSLRNLLVRYSDQFERVVAEKLLTYGLGRGVEYQDMPTVRSIVRDAAPGKYKFSSIVLGIVKSPAFQMNMKTETGKGN